jgi:hypothetical protein
VTRSAAVAMAAAGAALAVIAGGCGGSKSPSAAATTTAPAASTTPTGLPGHPIMHSRPSGLGGTPFPSPPLGAVTFGGETPFLVPAAPNPDVKGPQLKTQPDAVGLAVIPEQGRLGLQASVVDEATGGGASGLTISFRLGPPGSGTYVAAPSCGPGCYGTFIDLTKPPGRIAVTLGADHAQKVEFTMPAAWPPPPAAAHIARAERTWHALTTLVWHDNLAAGGPVTVHSVWKVIAPNRVAFRIHNSGEDGLSQIIIGPLKWFHPPGGEWGPPTKQTPLHQPVPLWASAVNPYLLGTVMERGRPAWKISFFDPRTPGWFTVVIDKQSARTMRITMIANVHFMHDVYGPFNAPITITPPNK